MVLDNVTFISYTGGSVLFSALFLITLTLFRRKSLVLSIPLAMLLSAIWCGLLALDALTPRLGVIQMQWLETLRTGSWIAAILHQLRHYNRHGTQQGPFLLLNFLWLGSGVLFSFGVPLLVPDARFQYGYVWGNLLLSILGVVAVEQLFRNSPQHRISKFIGVGLGAAFLYDLYLFSVASLFEQLDQGLWQARGAVNGMAAIFLAIGLLGVSGDRTLHPNRVAMSRPMAFYTTSLTSAGFFLALMAACGYYIKLYGGNWGTLIQILLMTLALTGIAVLFLSDSARTKLSVFIDKHFFVHKYDYRSQWLNLIHQLTATGNGHQDVHQRAILAVAGTFKCPGGMLWLNNRFGKFHPVASLHMRTGNLELEEPADSNFCRILREQEWVFSPHAPTHDELGTHNESLPDWSRRMSDIWLIMPLLVDHELIGFMVLAAPAQESPLTWEDLDLLKTVGREVAVYLSRNESAEMLAQSKQFDAYNKLTAFIMHDLKNLIAQQALVVENAARHKENPAFVDDMIRTIDNSVQRMSNLLKKLQQTQPTSGRSLPLKNVVINSVKKCQDRVPRPSLRILNDSLKVVADEDNLEMIITHIIKNAQEATPAQGYVDVVMRSNGGLAIIDVEDNGSGMDAEFIRKRLFRPFDTTKSGKGMGIGVYQTREFIRNLGGDVTVRSEPGIGTTFTISIPVDAPAKTAS